MSSSTTSTPRIAIVGGGPGGLLLLLTLHRRGIPATLYERDEGFNARAHLGGTLDLHWNSGQRALRENGLYEQFEKLSRPEGEETKIYDASGKLYFSKGFDESRDPADGRPEIDRSVLRQLLLSACPADSIKWSHALVSVEALPNGQHKLAFSNGFSTTCDILVGADGARSRIRPLLSPATPMYSGYNGAEISLAPDVVSRPDMADVREHVGKGSVFGLQKSKMLGSQMNGDGRIRTYAWFQGPEDWVLPREPAEARRVLKEVFAGWSATYMKLIEHCDDDAIYHRPLYYLPVGHSWKHVPGVTLVGDAAHQMSSFAGAGANLAMLDGLNLGLVLAEAISGGKTVEGREAAIEKWEAEMFATSGEIAAESKANMETIIHPDAPGPAVVAISKMMKKKVGDE